MTEIENPQYDRATCYFCLSEETEVLEEHHIVPRRYGGGDEPKNMVLLCPTCHRKVERLYDMPFYEELDVEQEKEEEEEELEVVTTTSQRDRIMTVLDLIEEVGEEHNGEAPVEIVKRRCFKKGLEPDKVEEEIDQLKQKGEVFEPQADTLMTT